MSSIGNLVIVKAEFTDRAGWKLRPGLVIGEYLDDYLIAFMSKQVARYKDESTSIVIDNDDLLSGRLKRKSVVRAHKTFWTEKKLCQKFGALKKGIADKVLRLNSKYFLQNYYDFYHRPKKLILGKSLIPYAGRVYDEKEIINLVNSALDFWLTTGRFNDAFQKRFAEFLGVKHVLTTNSGSSANLLALSALTSPKLGEKRLRPGDEVISVATGFPTTVNPIIQNGLVPVFVDVDIPTYNINSKLIEEAVGKKTRAIMLAHTLGNPFDLNEVMRVARKYDLWVIEDCCDALGSLYAFSPIISKGYEPEAQRHKLTDKCGTFGHISTFSFYPAHHITMGEGGALGTNDSKLKKIIESFRDWGRDCWCKPGQDNTCKKRFEWQLGELPYGYDHKYIYSHIGYNLKLTDMQAAVGLAQLEKLPGFIEARKRNFQALYEGLYDLQEFFILPEPTPNSDPSWFGFPLAIRTESPFSRDTLIRYLDQRKIGTRLLFGGNLTRQPAYQDLPYRKVGELADSDFVMNQVFWVGIYPGLTQPMIDYMLENLRGYVKKNNQRGVSK